jgi:DNA-binding LacI/PurR family transcriptional regulator
MSNIHIPKARIVQPNGIRYMISEYHYSRENAAEYLAMLISKMEDAIIIKKRGERIAPLMTLEQMEDQLKFMKQFIIVDIKEDVE